MLVRVGEHHPHRPLPYLGGTIPILRRLAPEPRITGLRLTTLNRLTGAAEVALSRLQSRRILQCRGSVPPRFWTVSISPETGREGCKRERFQVALEQKQGGEPTIVLLRPLRLSLSADGWRLDNIWFAQLDALSPPSLYCVGGLVALLWRLS